MKFMRQYDVITYYVLPNYSLGAERHERDNMKSENNKHFSYFVL